MIAEGAAAIDSLPTHAERIANLLATNFPAQTLSAVHDGMRPSLETAKGGVNAKVAELSNLCREEAAVAAAQFRQCEMWLRLKAPAVSDGNNFGVDVQNYVLTEMKEMRTAMESMVTAGKDYYWSRAQGLEKILGEDKTSKTSSEDRTADTEDGKTTEKLCKKTSSSTTATSAAGYPDYREYVVCVDVRQYHLVFNHLTDMRNNYIKAHVLFAKNMKRLNDPRGEGADGRSGNVMSMF